MIGIICIFYNNFEFLLRQYEHLKVFCTEPYDLIVVDNSSDEKQSEAIKWHAENLALEYVRTKASSVGGSDSHAFAASFAYHKYRQDYDILFYIDHDCFSIKPFRPSEILVEETEADVYTKRGCTTFYTRNKKLMAGLPQLRNGKKYYWPGCFMFKTSVAIDWQMISGYDTGGGTYKAIELHGEENCIFFDEAYCQNPGFPVGKYNFYALINNGMFMHFINGSNWANSADNTERLNSLFNVLKTYLPDVESI